MSSSTEGDVQWDVVIVGAGMGGSTAAYQLALNGHRVLLLEKGLSSFPNGGPESAIRIEEDQHERMREGHWPHRLSATIDGNSVSMWPALGCGTGGTTLIYAAALERLSPQDFEGSTMAGVDIYWPFSYQDLEPYYQKAESIYNVTGSIDPLESDINYNLSPPPSMTEADATLFTEFSEAILHPYRLHVGAKFLPGCSECGGHYCSRECKSDALNCCLKPAQKTGNLKILSQTDVIEIESNQSRAVAIKAISHGNEVSFTARYYILASGALFTPVILQNSKSEFWPKGLGNNFDLVGRNLMFHASDFIAIWPNKKSVSKQPTKAIAFRDFYRHDGQALGTVQSMGLNAGYGNILHFLSNVMDQSFLRHIKPLKYFLRIPAYIASKIYREAVVFASIIEDFPYPENRVIADKNKESGMHFIYNKKPELILRVKSMRKQLKKTLYKHRIMVVNRDINLNYGHPCGTCRSGHDPKTSVVDKDCKLHNVDNVYITDASFMPSSGGTNPSLTIAANALRVGDIISKRLKTSAKT